MAKRYGCFPQYVMGPSYKCRVCWAVVPAGQMSDRGYRTYRAIVPAGHGCVGMGWGAARMVGKPRRGYSLVEMRVRVASRPAGTGGC